MTKIEKGIFRTLLVANVISAVLAVVTGNYGTAALNAGIAAMLWSIK